MTRQRIDELANGLRQAGVYGKYDGGHGQFVEEPPRKPWPKKG